MRRRSLFDRYTDVVERAPEKLQTACVHLTLAVAVPAGLLAMLPCFVVGLFRRRR